MNNRRRVFDALCTRDWWPLPELIEVTGTTAAQAYMRDLRKAQYGGFRIEKRKGPDGTWQYRLDRTHIVPERTRLIDHPSQRLAWKDAATGARPVLSALVTVDARRQFGEPAGPARAARLALLDVLLQHGYLEPADMRERLR